MLARQQGEQRVSKKPRTCFPNKVFGNLITKGHFVWGAGCWNKCFQCSALCSLCLSSHCHYLRFLCLHSFRRMVKSNAANSSSSVLRGFFFTLLVFSISCTMLRMPELLQLGDFDQQSVLNGREQSLASKKRQNLLKSETLLQKCSPCECRLMIVNSINHCQPQLVLSYLFLFCSIQVSRNTWQSSNLGRAKDQTVLLFIDS